MNACRFLLALTFVFSLLSSGQSRAQSSPVRGSETAVSQAEPHEPISQPGSADTAEVLAAIERLKQEARDAEQLTPEARAEVVELCDRAVAKLDEATKLEVTTSKLQRELETSASTLETLQSKKSDTQAEEFSATGILSEELRSHLSTADQKLSAARDELQRTTSEIQRRAERRKSLPALLANCREQLTLVMEVKKQPDMEQRSLLAEAQKLYLATRLVHRQKELKALEQENRTYEATLRLWLGQRDDAERKLQVATEQYKAIEGLVAEMQRQDAQRQARKARRTVIHAA